jgi:hypothetical protein
MNEKEFKEICSIKENRHKIYKLAKEYQKRDKPSYSMCVMIEFAIEQLYGILDDDFDMFYEYLTEFAAIKPNGVIGRVFWFDKKDLQIRLDHFDKLIKATE